MERVKGLARSKTIWSVLFLMAAAIGGPRVRAFLGDESNQLVLIEQVGIIIAGIAAIYGRIVATSSIQGITQKETRE